MVLSLLSLHGLLPLYTLMQLKHGWGVVKCSEREALIENLNSGGVHSYTPSSWCPLSFQQQEKWFLSHLSLVIHALRFVYTLMHLKHAARLLIAAFTLDSV